MVDRRRLSEVLTSSVSDCTLGTSDASPAVMLDGATTTVTSHEAAAAVLPNDARTAVTSQEAVTPVSPETDGFVTIGPLGGRLVIFDSSMEHEVLPTFKAR